MTDLRGAYSDNSNLPPRITDKRGQNKAPSPDAGPMLSEEEVQALTGDQVKGLLDRLAELRDKARFDALSQDELAEVQRIQTALAMAEPNPGNVFRAVTGFLVLIQHDGTVVLGTDVNIQMEFDRQPTINDLRTGVTMAQQNLEADYIAQNATSRWMQAMNEAQGRVARKSGLTTHRT